MIDLIKKKTNIECLFFLDSDLNECLLIEFAEIFNSMLKKQWKQINLPKRQTVKEFTRVELFFFHMIDMRRSQP
jgi:hypothetical protein